VSAEEVDVDVPKRFVYFSELGKADSNNDASLKRVSFILSVSSAGHVVAALG
jgi:hypothetical protein